MHCGSLSLTPSRSMFFAFKYSCDYIGHTWIISFSGWKQYVLNGSSKVPFLMNWVSLLSSGHPWKNIGHTTNTKLKIICVLLALHWISCAHFVKKKKTLYRLRNRRLRQLKVKITPTDNRNARKQSFCNICMKVNFLKFLGIFILVLIMIFFRQCAYSWEKERVWGEKDTETMRHTEREWIQEYVCGAQRSISHFVHTRCLCSSLLYAVLAASRGSGFL